MVINRPQKRLDLQAVGIAHILADEGFHSTFEIAYFKNFGLDTQLVERAFEESKFGIQTVPFHITRRIHIDFIGHRSQIIPFFGHYLIVGIHEFFRLFEVNQRIAHFLNGSPTRLWVL